MTKHTVLFELGCEELPPKSLKTLRDALKAETENTCNNLKMTTVTTSPTTTRWGIMITTV